MPDERPQQQRSRRDPNRRVSVRGGVVRLWPVPRSGADLTERPGRAPAAPITRPAPYGRPGALPTTLTSLVGRERELAAVASLLAGGGSAPGPLPRLLTLTGPGGVGKTRLALAVADRLPTVYADGVRWVDLAALGHADLLPHTVAAALGVRELPGRPILASLLTSQRRKRRLLVVDNCEHLTEACARLVDALLRACPGLQFLATSREPLGIAGETVWRVPPLAVPEALPVAPLEDVNRLGAVRLFAERARAALPDFTVTAQNVAAVAQVCRRLDGLPLALELAATRVTVLSVDQLAARLDDRFRLLSGHSPTALPRHQTLRATVDWSYALLPEAERALLRRLAVFVGGFTLAAAESVCVDEARGGGQGTDVLDLVSRLVDKSLVQVDMDEGGAPRYRLLETVREYGLERLRGADEEPAARARHVRWCQAFAAAAETPLRRADAGWLDQVAVEHDNLRAALAWSAGGEPGDAPASLHLAGSLWPYWWARGSPTEGRRWLERALEAVDAPTDTLAPDPGEARMKALIGAGVLAREQGDWSAARARLEAAVALSRGGRDQRVLAWALRESARLQMGLGDFERAQALFEESLARVGGDRRDVGETLLRLGALAESLADYARAGRLLSEGLAAAREAGDCVLIADMLLMLARVASIQADYERAETLVEEALAAAQHGGTPHQIVELRSWRGRMARMHGDTARAGRHSESALALARELEDPTAIAWALLELGKLALAQGAAEQAAERFDECLALFVDLGDKWGIGSAQQGLGIAASLQGDLPRMAARLREALALWRELVDRSGTPTCLEGLAAVAGAGGHAVSAGRLLGAADALREAIGVPVPAWIQPTYEAWVRTAQGHLDAAAFAQAQAAGQALGMDKAIAEALAIPEPAPDPAGATEPAAVCGVAVPFGLTPREVEVLRLLAQGASDAAIAQELSIAVRTANTHVARILGKTGTANRTAAAATARRLGFA